MRLLLAACVFILVALWLVGAPPSVVALVVTYGAVLLAAYFVILFLDWLLFP